MGIWRRPKTDNDSAESLLSDNDSAESLLSRLHFTLRIEALGSTVLVYLHAFRAAA